MNESLKNKLMFFILAKKKSNNDDSNIKSFLDDLRNGRVSETLVRYLYNYLYRNSTKSDLGIDVEHKDGSIILEECEKKNKAFRFKRSNISLTDGLGDIRRKTLIVETPDDFKTYLCTKSIHYALDTAIDLVVLESPYVLCKNKEELKLFGADDNNYSRVSFITKESPRVYRTYENIKDESLREHDSYINKDEIISIDTDNPIHSDNLTTDTETTYDYLEKLYKRSYVTNASYDNININYDDSFDNLYKIVKNPKTKNDISRIINLLPKNNGGDDLIEEYRPKKR